MYKVFNETMATDKINYFNEKMTELACTKLLSIDFKIIERINCISP